MLAAQNEYETQDSLPIVAYFYEFVHLLSIIGEDTSVGTTPTEVLLPDFWGKFSKSKIRLYHHLITHICHTLIPVSLLNPVSRRHKTSINCTTQYATFQKLLCVCCVFSPILTLFLLPLTRVAQKSNPRRKWIWGYRNAIKVKVLPFTPSMINNTIFVMRYRLWVSEESGKGSKWI